MANSPQKLEQLEALMDGTLSETEAKELERELDENPAFLAEAQAYYQLIKNLQNADPNRQKIKALLQSVPKASARVVRLQTMRRIAIAASLLVLALLSLWLFLPDVPQSNPLVVEKDSDFELTLRGTGVRSGPVPSAEKEYYNENYQLAARIFDEAYHKEQGKDKLLYRYNYGVCQYKAGKYSEAQSAFEEVAQSKDNLNEDAQFYLALSYYKNKQYPKSKLVIQEILKVTDHGKAKEAKQLLAKMKKK